MHFLHTVTESTRMEERWQAIFSTEFRLYMMPVVLGGGKPYFEAGLQLELEPLGVESLPQQCTLLRFRPKKTEPDRALGLSSARRTAIALACAVQSLWRIGIPAVRRGRSEGTAWSPFFTGLELGVQLAA